MRPRSFFLAVLAVACVLIATTFVPTPRQDVAVLDRLAPKIERAQTLAPETKDAIMQLIERARMPTGDPRHDAQRSVTIERVTDAIRMKDARPEPGTTGQASPDDN
jgi:hypothetical protein